MAPLLIYLSLVPLGIMLLAKRWAWIEKISPMTVLYAIGLAVGNSGFVPETSAAQSVSVDAGNIAIAVAIPLMLMGCNLKKWSTGKALKAFCSGLLAVTLATFAGFFLFRNMTSQNLTHDDYAKVCAVATGIYTGGIPNMGAIKQGVDMGQELYLCVTVYDLIVTSLYLVFIIFLGKTVFRKALPHANTLATSVEAPSDDIVLSNADKSQPGPHQTWFASLLPIALTGLIVALSYLVTSAEKGINMTLFILLLTTLSIMASFLPPIRRQDHSFNVGLYFVNVFALSIATSCDISRLNLLGNLGILAYIAFIVFGSVMLQILLSKFMKLDGDTVMVTSVALINSPPFVPLVSALLKNKEIVLVGIFVGLLGYMLGNYLGIGIYHLLQLFE
ncbi:MAG: DUF819 family protein [Bacteroidales bacterium]|nr:DUF819 family protein [Bacteroidales bacterium]